MSEQSEDAVIVNAVTAIVREADTHFMRTGGSSRHWVRDCFLPTLNASGYVVASASPLGPWRSMESAPKDGPVLVSDGRLVWIAPNPIRTRAQGKATYWCPLPVPPQEDK